MCSLWMYKDMVVVEFDICSVLVVRVFDRRNLFVVVMFGMCSQFVRMRSILFFDGIDGYMMVVVMLVDYIGMIVGKYQMWMTVYMVS